MQQALRPSSLMPPCFTVVGASTTEGMTTIVVRSTSCSSSCPGCGIASSRVHSRYQRRVADLPLAGRSVSLIATIRRFTWLDEQWAGGCHNGTEIWRRLKARGFRGSLRVVTEWATRRRRAEAADDETLHRIPSARTIARLMTIGHDTLSRAETVIVAAVETGVPLLVAARELIDRLHVMLRRKAGAELDPWIAQGRASLVASFANGVARDIAAVRAAIVSRWSNGQTEGQITKLKLVNRQMYGRGKLDLLQARLIGAE
jgi:transposase